ncbi:DUF397 domain-containing protein [Streptomyces sp. ODS05-4]|uniref:DUF397 domain-containing protein n=1 Tax=Streptomyces sp. ODS05-4 TaxID=2944939 RepID=UPI00210E9A2C|nr:DUF397 domain-containing protein [Streptomyces sp. ODS05-4]
MVERVANGTPGEETADGVAPANGIPAGRLTSARWIKSSHSNPVGNCVELSPLADGSVAVRNSRDPEGPALVYTRAEIAAFLAGARDGDFDSVLG